LPVKAIKVLAIIVVVLVVLLVAGVFFLNRYVQSPAFKDTVLSSARGALGSEVKINDFDVSLFSGVTLRGVAIGNPEGFPGDLLSADAFVLRYRLLPLLSKRLEIEQLSLEKPVLRLMRGAGNAWNYEKIGGASSGGTGGGGSAQPASSPATSAPLDVTLSKLAMNHGEFVVLNEKNKMLVRIQDVELSSSVNLEGSKLTGRGRAGIETINVADSLFARQLEAPVSITTDEVKLSPLSGKLAGGDVSGELILKLAGGMKYLVNLQLDNGNVSKLLEEAGAKKQVMTGKLHLTTKLEGTGGLPTIVGFGNAEIKDGKLLDVPVLNLLATLLQVAELRDLKFDECTMQYVITNNVMQTQEIRVISPRVQITGTGTVSLEDYSLNHNLTLALAKGMLDRVPKEIRGIFTERPDGFLALDFRVSGPYDSPKTDLTARLAKGAADQLLQKGIEKLFK
jgi:hypothetical protein